MHKIFIVLALSMLAIAAYSAPTDSDEAEHIQLVEEHTCALRCDGGNLCVMKHEICDGIAECDDESDEADCGSSSTSTKPVEPSTKSLDQSTTNTGAEEPHTTTGTAVSTNAESSSTSITPALPEIGRNDLEDSTSTHRTSTDQTSTHSTSTDRTSTHSASTPPTSTPPTSFSARSANADWISIGVVATYMVALLTM